MVWSSRHCKHFWGTSKETGIVVNRWENYKYTSHELNAGQKYVVWGTGEPCGTPACISLDKDISPSTEIEFSINYADQEV